MQLTKFRYQHHKLFLLFFFVLINPLIVKAQYKGYYQPQNPSLSFGISTNTSLSGFNNSLPFWHHANKNGKYDQHSANAVFLSKYFQPILTMGDLSINSSAKIAGRASAHSWFGIQSLAATINYDFLQFRGGRFSDPVGFNYRPLSSGSMLYSTNALPIPKLVLRTNGFVNAPFTNGHLQFSSYLSHGWFEESRYIKNAYLHQKYFYLKINYKLFEAIGGIIHNVQWGGIHPQKGKLPQSFHDYLRMVLSNGTKSTSDAPDAEIKNSIGNSVAGYDFNLRIDLNRYELTFYRLFYLEDKVSTRFRSPWDGMWGFGLLTKEDYSPLNALVYEHINTKRQDSFDFEPRGSANYYGNGIYRSGWTYKNRVIGNPMILTDGSTNRPIYNNIIVAHHLGANGFISQDLKWKVYYTYSRNYGDREDQIIERYEIPDNQTINGKLRPLNKLKKANHSVYLGTTLYPLKKFNLELAVAGDFGQLYDNRIGIMLGAKYKLY